MFIAWTSNSKAVRNTTCTKTLLTSDYDIKVGAVGSEKAAENKKSKKSWS